MQTNQNRREHACGGRQARARRPRWRQHPPEHRRACAAGRHSIRRFPELAARASSARTRAHPRAGAAGGAALVQCARAKRLAIRQAPIRMPRRVRARGSVRAREAAGDEAGADQDAAAGPPEGAQLGLAAVHRQAQQDGEQRINRQDHLPRARRPCQPPRPSAPESVARAPAPCSRASRFRFASGFMLGSAAGRLSIGFPNQPYLCAAWPCLGRSLRHGGSPQHSKGPAAPKGQACTPTPAYKLLQPAARVPATRPGAKQPGGTHHLRAPGGACLPRGRADAGLRGQLRDFARTEGPCAARRPAQDSGHATERARPQRCTLPLTYT